MPDHTPPPDNDEQLFRHLERYHGMYIAHLRETRNNALALVGTIFLMLTAIIQVPSPLVHTARMKDYSGLVQRTLSIVASRLLNLTTHDEKAQLLVTIWGACVLLTLCSSFVTATFTIKIFYHSGPLLTGFTGQESARPLDSAVFRRSLVTDNKNLKFEIERAGNGLRYSRWAAIATVLGAVMLTALWALFGSIS